MTIPPTLRSEALQSQAVGYCRYHRHCNAVLEEMKTQIISMDMWRTLNRIADNILTEHGISPETKHVNFAIIERDLSDDELAEIDRRLD